MFKDYSLKGHYVQSRTNGNQNFSFSEISSNITRYRQGWGLGWIQGQGENGQKKLVCDFTKQPFEDLK